MKLLANVKRKALQMLHVPDSSYLLLYSRDTFFKAFVVDYKFSMGLALGDYDGRSIVGIPFCRFHSVLRLQYFRSLPSFNIRASNKTQPFITYPQ